MTAQTLAIVILLPFAVAFIAAGIHEFRRFKSKGRATYGLVFDEETGTSHVAGIAEDEDGYDPDDFDPRDHNERPAEEKTDGKDA